MLDCSPELCYKKWHVLPGGFIPGPSKPKIVDSFLFPWLRHLAILQNKGRDIWNTLDQTIFRSYPTLALIAANGPAMACISGWVGHHGHCHCCYHWHKLGGSHYYPVRLKPDNYNLDGCDHGDVDLEGILSRLNSQTATHSYFNDLKKILIVDSKVQYKRTQLETGICKPTIFLGLHPDHTLPIPSLFAGDSMHLASLNVPNLFLALWRGTISCGKTDSKSSWWWLILGDSAVWKAHGKSVADTTPYIPGSFDRPPRNPAEKLNSGYKAWEFLLYIFGLGPALFYRLLPTEYWVNYCKAVRAMWILLQVEIDLEELREAHSLLSEFSDEYKKLYVQRCTDHIHFVRASIHTPSHMPPETICIGPSVIFSQWTMEQMIGNWGEEIKQHSNLFSNLAKRGLHWCQINALKSMISDLELPEVSNPRGSLDIGDSYLLLTATEVKATQVHDCKAKAIDNYLHSLNPDIDCSRYHCIKWWARVRLPNGQITCSR